MKKDDLIKFMEGLNPPEIELPSYTRRLRKALLASSYFQKHPKVDVLALNDILKEIFMLKKTIILTGIVCAMVIAMVVGTGFLLNNNSHAQAQDVIDKAMGTVENISPDDVAVLEKRFGVSLQMTLKEAKAAPDLTIMNENEIKDVFITVSTSGVEEASQFLRYTNPGGKEVIMGLNHDGVPIMMVINVGDKECIGVIQSNHEVEKSNSANSNEK